MTEDPTLKHDNRLVGEILDRNKVLTARHGLDDDITVDEDLVLTTESGTPFAIVTVDSIKQMRVKEFVDANLDGHRTYGSQEAMLSELRGYYPRVNLSPHTILDVVWYRNLRYPNGEEVP